MDCGMLFCLPLRVFLLLTAKPGPYEHYPPATKHEHATPQTPHGLRLQRYALVRSVRGLQARLDLAQEQEVEVSQGHQVEL